MAARSENGAGQRTARGAGGKKQVLLRLDAETWNEIAAWAEDEFRSINGQIEYLLSEAVRDRRHGKK